MTYTRTRCQLPKLNLSHSVVIITKLFKIPPIYCNHLDSRFLIQNHDQHHNYSDWTNKRYAYLQHSYNSTDTNFVVVLLLLLSVVVVVVVVVVVLMVVVVVMVMVSVVMVAAATAVLSALLDFVSKIYFITYLSRFRIFRGRMLELHSP